MPERRGVQEAVVEALADQINPPERVSGAPIASRRLSLRAKARFTNLAPRSARGLGRWRDARPRRRPLQNLALLEHFVVAAFAATKPPRSFPRAERGA